MNQQPPSRPYYPGGAQPPYQPSQPGYPPPPSPQNNGAYPYGKNILLGHIIATVLSFILIGLGGNTTGSPSFLANAGTSIFLGVIVSILIVDWKGLVSLHGWIKWQHMEKKKKTSLGCLFFFVFPLMLCIYLVRACLASFQSTSSSHARLATPNNNRAKIGIITGSVVALISLAFATGTSATGAHTATDRATPTTIAQTHQKSTTVPPPKLTIAPTTTPTPTPKPTVAPTTTPTPAPTLTPRPTSAPQPTQPPQQTGGVNGNPWGYDFHPGNLIYSPPENFCDYFHCITSFWKSTNGYVDECNDGTYSHSGGRSGACSKHGKEMRPLYSHSP